MAKERSIRYILLRMLFGNFRKYHSIFYFLQLIPRYKFFLRTYINFYRNLNIYDACVPDRMHHIDLGLFKYQLEFTQDILKEVGGTELQKEFDERLRKIPHFPGLRFLNKLGHLNVITASDYWHIMKIALFALDNIFDEWNHGITCRELCDLYAKFSKMYIMSRKESYSEKDLKIFEVSQRLSNFFFFKDYHL